MLFSFILVLFLSNYYVTTIQLKDSFTFESEQCDDAYITIEFTRIENFGAGNAEEVVTLLPSGVEYYNNEKIGLLFEPSYNDEFLLNNLFLSDYSGVIMEQGNHYVHFILEGSQSGDDIEIVDFDIYFENALVEVIVDDPDHALEAQGDGIYEDLPNQDEIIILPEENMVEAHLRVSSLDDGFYLYYSCLE